jgi:hypothetical protein
MPSPVVTMVTIVTMVTMVTMVTVQTAGAYDKGPAPQRDRASS